MKPELKFGRKVLVRKVYSDKQLKKATFLTRDPEDDYTPFFVLLDEDTDNGTGAIWVRDIQIDLSAPPMSGDEVEAGDNNKDFPHKGRYLGQRRYDGKYAVENCAGIIIGFNYIRHPQPSKRDRVEEFLNSYYYPCNAEKIADQIDKIYTEDL